MEKLDTLVMNVELTKAKLEYDPFHGCKSKSNIHQGRWTWLSITILLLAVYSTVFSGIYLFVAIRKPRYGQHIHSAGKLSPSTATLISAIFAKTIELSFVTVFVAFLGQALSRRAFVRNSNGVTIAEMSMRSWIMQPGSMITHWESVKYGALTFLGMVSLTAALLAMLYTSASEALGMSAAPFSASTSTLTSEFSFTKIEVRFLGEPDYVRLGKDILRQPDIYREDVSYSNKG